MATTIKFEFKDLKRLTKVLRSDDLLAEPFRKGLEQLGQESLAQFQNAAPKGATGRTVSMMRMKVQSRPVPTWVAVRIPAKQKRYSYPRRTAFDRSFRTYGWYDRAVSATRARWGAFLSEIGRQLESRWRRM